jgi:hypothetical protein
MAELHSDLHEIKDLVAEIKADRTAAREKERREAWTRYVSLSVVIIAVLAAIATQWSGKYSNRMLARLNDATYQQAQASDLWSYYQSKSIKQNLYEVSRAPLPAASPEEAVQRQRKEFDDKIARYEKEKQEIMDQARKLEAQRDSARRLADEAGQKGAGMGLAVALFSIAIALASICLVTKKRPLWFAALAMGSVAALQMILVWLR